MKIKLRNVISVILTIVVVLQSYFAYYYPIFRYIDELIVIAVFIAAILDRGKKYDNMILKIILLLTLFFLTGVLSAAVNSGGIKLYTFLSGFLSIKFVLLVVLFQFINLRMQDVSTVNKTLVLLGHIDVFTILLNYFIPSLYKSLFPMALTQERLGMVVSTGFFEQTAMNAFFLAYLAMYYFARFLVSKKRAALRKFFYFAFFAVLTMRMKTIIGILVTLTFCSFIVLKKKSKKYKYLILVAIMGGIAGYVFREQLIFTYKHYFTLELGESARMMMMLASFKIARDYFPFGVGFAKYGSAFSRTYYSEYYYLYGLNRVYGLEPGRSTAMLDVYWPSIIGECGMIGTILYLFVFLFILKALLNSSKAITKINISDTERVVVLTGFLVFVESLFESLGDYPYNSCVQFVLISYAVGMALKIVTSSKKEKIKSDK